MGFLFPGHNLKSLSMNAKEHLQQGHASRQQVLPCHQFAYSREENCYYIAERWVLAIK